MKQLKIWKCFICKKRYKKAEMRHVYGGDILLGHNECIYCLGIDKNIKSGITNA